MRSTPCLLSLVVVLTVLLYPLAARPASDEDIRRVGEQLVCYCGCPGLAVAECSCGTADGIRERIAGQLDSGLTTEQVVAAWLDERGEQILAVPTREGFNMVGWVMPFVVMIVALSTLTLALLRRKSQLATATSAPGSGASTDATADADRQYLDRIKNDMQSRHS